MLAARVIGSRGGTESADNHARQKGNKNDVFWAFWTFWKREESLATLHGMQAAQQPQLHGAQTSLTDNKERECLLLGVLGKPAGSDVSTSALVGASSCQSARKANAEAFGSICQGSQI